MSCECFRWTPSESLSWFYIQSDHFHSMYEISSLKLFRQFCMLFNPRYENVIHSKPFFISFSSSIVVVSRDFLSCLFSPACVYWKLNHSPPSLFDDVDSHVTKLFQTVKKWTRDIEAKINKLKHKKDSFSFDKKLILFFIDFTKEEQLKKFELKRADARGFPLFWTFWTFAGRKNYTRT